MNFTDDEIDNIIGPVCEIADLDCENVEDPLLRDLINAAQRLRDREGFLVTDGDELDLDPRTPDYGVASAVD